MFGTLTLGRPLGIRLGVHWSFWLLPLFVLFSNLGPLGVAGAGFKVASLLAVFGCVALHELGHAAAAKLFGIRTRDIVLYPLGGVANLERMPRNPFQEIAIALAGPAVNVVIAGMILPFLLFGGSFGTAEGTVASAFFEQLMWANVVLVAFNMLPAFPMDGGRVLRAVLAMFLPRVQATSIAATIGTGFAILFGMIGVLSGQFMLLVLAMFLFVIGRAEERDVRAEEEDRERRQFRGTRLGWPIAFEIPVVTNTRPADGWVFDASSQMWTKWEHGVAVARSRNP